MRTGASLPMLFELLQQAAKPAMERLTLLRRVVFQVLIGNPDAHAKNLTFMMGPAGLTLAPAYDLVCGLLCADGHLEDAYAMAIGDAFAPAQLSAYEWAQFAVATQLPPRLVRKVIDEVSQATVNALDRVSVETRAEGAQAAVVERIQR